MSFMETNNRFNIIILDVKNIKKSKTKKKVTNTTFAKRCKNKGYCYINIVSYK